MSTVKWIKLSTSMFDASRKIKQIELMPEGDTILVIWIKLLLLAGNINDGGQIYLTPGIPYTDEMLANELRRPLTTVRMALQLFAMYGMIEVKGNIIILSSWDKYQNIEGLERIREQTRLRVEKCREKKRIQECNVTVTPGNALEGGEDQEKDNSIFLSKATDCDEEIFSTRESAKRTYFGGKLGKGVVLLSEDQINDLLDKLSVDEFDHYVTVVADCILRGKRYKKTHYQAILDMAEQDRKTR